MRVSSCSLLEATVSQLTCVPSHFISEPVRNGIKSRPRRQEEEDEGNDDDDDEASEPADSILGSESEGEETNEVDGLLDE